MSWMAKLVPDNPVLIKEMRVRMRGAKAYWILLGYLGFLAMLLLFQYFNFSEAITSTGVGGSRSSELGSQLFLWIIIPQVFLVLFITPAITSGSITIENEQQTMDMLTMTRLSRSSIVVGKLLSAVSFTALLIISSLPLLSVCFMLGSIDPGQVLSAYLQLLSASVLIGAMGLMWSSIARTTTSAVILTYVTLFLVFVFGSGVFANRGMSGGAGGNLAGDLFNALGIVWFGDTFLGIKSVDGVGFSVLCLLLGILMSAVATVRLEMWPDRKAYILRAITLSIVGAFALMVDVAWVSWYYHFNSQISSRQAPAAILVYTAATMWILIPIFATGDLAPFEARKFRQYLRWGWSRKGLMRGKLASGLPFLLITLIVCLMAYAVPFVAMGKAGDIFRSGARSQGITNTSLNSTILWGGEAVTSAAMQPGSNGVTIYTMVASDGSNLQANVVKGQVVSLTVNGQPTNPQSGGLVIGSIAPGGTGRRDSGDVPQAVVALVAAVIGLSLFCSFLSLLFRNRWVAILVTYIGMFACLVVPETTIAGANSVSNNFLEYLLTNLFYLNPMQAIMQISEPDVYWLGRNLLFGHTPVWLVTSVLWTVIGGLSCLAMWPIVRREATRNAPIPYEELVADA